MITGHRMLASSAVAVATRATAAAAATTTAAIRTVTGYLDGVLPS